MVSVKISQQPSYLTILSVFSHVRRFCMNRIVLFLLLCLPLSLFGQSSNVRLNTRVFNFGTVENWTNPPATFIVKNESSQPMYFLPVYYEPDIRIEFPNGSVLPGQSAEIRVYYYSDHLGHFSRSFNIYTSFSAQPIELQVVGNIKNISGSALTRCPNPNELPVTSVKSIRFHLYDSLTKAPLQTAILTINGPGKNVFGPKLPASGIYQTNIPHGIYALSARCTGYKGRFGRLWVSTGSPEDIWLGLLPGSDDVDSTDRPELAVVDSTSKTTVSFAKDSAATDEIPADFSIGNASKRVKIIVVDTLGNGIKDAKVELKNADRSFKMLRSPQTGSWYEVMPTSTYQVSAEKATFYPYSAEVKVTAKTEEVRIVLKQMENIGPPITSAPRPKAYRQQIQLVDAETGMPIRNGSMLVEGNGYRFSMLRTASDGLMSELLTPGMYSFKGSCQGYIDTAFSARLLDGSGKMIIPLMRDPNAPKPVNLKPQTIVVLDENGDVPIRGVSIKLESADRIYQLNKTNSAGTTSKNLIPSSYFIKIEQPGYFKVNIGAYLDGTEYTVRLKKDPAYLSDSVVFTHKVVKQDTIAKDPGKPVSVGLNDDGVLSSEFFIPNNLILVIDASSSMNDDFKLPLLKESIHNLVPILRNVDYITILIYNNKTTLLVPPTPATMEDSIFMKIDTLNGQGNSFGQNALEMAYRFAKNGFIEGGNNQVLLATDGMFNNYGFREKTVYEMVAQNAADGIPTSVLAFGKDDKAINFLKQVSKKGKGNFWHVKGKNSSKHFLVKEVKMMSYKKKAK